MKKNEWVWFGITLAALLLVATWLRLAHAAESTGGIPGGFGDFKDVSAGVAIIAIFAGLVFRVLPGMVSVVLAWLGKRDEVFTAALEKRDQALAHIVDRMEAQAQLQREHNERQTARLHEAVKDEANDIRAEIRGLNGAGRR